MINRLAKTVLILFCLFCLVGACFIYVVDYNQSASAHLNPDGSVSYEISGFFPSEYSYMVLDNVHMFDSIYFYYDERYPVHDTTHLEVDVLYDTLDRLLDSRGYDGFHQVDADDLRDVLVDVSNASDSAIFVATGSLPSTVHGGNGYPLLESWLTAGGTMYWMNGNPCSAYSTQSDVFVYNGMFDESLFNKEISDKGATDCTYLAERFGFGYTSIDNAIRKDAPNSRPIGLTNGEYSSLSVLPSPYGGNVFLFGGSASSMSFEQVSAFADYLVCGVTGETVIISEENGSKGYGHMVATTRPITFGDLFYLKVGKPNTIVGSAVEL